jgi:opacity protein-like surface antigen
MTFFLAPVVTALVPVYASQFNEPDAPAPETVVPLVDSSPLEPRYAVYDETLGEPSPWYWTIGADVTTTRPSDGPDEEIDFDEGWAAHVAVGYRFFGATDDAMAWDVELEGFYTDQESDDDAPGRPIQDINSTGLLVKGLANFQVARSAELFAGVGLGMSWLDIGTGGDSFNDFDDDDGPFLTWTVHAGVRFDVSEAVDLELGYRFLNIDDAEIDDEGIGDADFDLQTRQHLLGLSLRFGA